MSTRVWYSRNADGYRHCIDLVANIDLARADADLLAEVAEDCADDFHGNHDGWEAAWPVTLHLYSSRIGQEIGRFEIERETRPVFHAVPIKDAA